MSESSAKPTTKPGNPGASKGASVSSHQARSERAKRNLSKHNPGTKRENKYRNVHIAQKDQAIWEYFRARTQPGTQIFIGKNTIIGPGVQLFADKGTIKIGDNNIVGEGTIIINKSKEDLIIGNGNVFECNCRIEGSRINDYNVFGAKCHVMSGALIGTGCVICPRVMIIAKKRVRDCMVVFGDNMVHEQPLMKKRNRAYIDQMVNKLRTTFKEMKQSGGPKHGPRRPGQHHGPRGRYGHGHGSKHGSKHGPPRQQRIDPNRSNRARREIPVSSTQNKPTKPSSYKPSNPSDVSKPKPT